MPHPACAHERLLELGGRRELLLHRGSQQAARGTRRGERACGADQAVLEALDAAARRESRRQLVTVQHRGDGIARPHPGAGGGQHVHLVALPATQSKCFGPGERGQHTLWPGVHPGDPPPLRRTERAVVLDDRESLAPPPTVAEFSPDLATVHAVLAESAGGCHEHWTRSGCRLGLHGPTMTRRDPAVRRQSHAVDEPPWRVRAVDIDRAAATLCRLADAVRRACTASIESPLAARALTSRDARHGAGIVGGWTARVSRGPGTGTDTPPAC